MVKRPASTANACPTQAGLGRGDRSEHFRKGGGATGDRDDAVKIFALGNSLGYYTKIQKW